MTEIIIPNTLSREYVRDTFADYAENFTNSVQENLNIELSLRDDEYETGARLAVGERELPFRHDSQRYLQSMGMAVVRLAIWLPEEPVVPRSLLSRIAVTVPLTHARTHQTLIELNSYNTPEFDEPWLEARTYDKTTNIGIGGQKLPDTKVYSHDIEPMLDTAEKLELFYQRSFDTLDWIASASFPAGHPFRLGPIDSHNPRSSRK